MQISGFKATLFSVTKPDWSNRRVVTILTNRRARFNATVPLSANHRLCFGRTLRTDYYKV